MITNRTGDLLEQVDLELIAHQVNCKGAMGAGLAKDIAHRYPKMYQKYRSITLAYGENLMGTFAAVGTDGRTIRLNRLVEGDSCLVVNVFAQKGYGRGRRQTDYKAFERAFTKLKDEMVARGVHTVGVPHGIGCGLAGGDWTLVYGILDRIFGHDDRVELVIVSFEP